MVNGQWLYLPSLRGLGYNYGDRYRGQFSDGYKQHIDGSIIRSDDSCQYWSVVVDIVQTIRKVQI